MWPTDESYPIHACCVLVLPLGILEAEGCRVQAQYMYVGNSCLVCGEIPRAAIGKKTEISTSNTEEETQGEAGEALVTCGTVDTWQVWLHSKFLSQNTNKRRKENLPIISRNIFMKKEIQKS